MKTKLLRKIRKRFDWYINSKGFPVLLDKAKKSVVVIDVPYLKDFFDMSDKDVTEQVEVRLEEWAWRNLKNKILQPFGYNMGNFYYKIAVRKSRTKNYALASHEKI